VDNTYLFTAMCKFFDIKYKNPTVTEEEPKPFIKTASLEENLTRSTQRHFQKPTFILFLSGQLSSLGTKKRGRKMIDASCPLSVSPGTTIAV
jgi:hypothetical protein